MNWPRENGLLKMLEWYSKLMFLLDFLALRMVVVFLYGNSKSSVRQSFHVVEQ
jgi:hypothetical protein